MKRILSAVLVVLLLWAGPVGAAERMTPERSFQGHRRADVDATQDFGARRYGAARGRFLAADAGPVAPAHPQTWNRYAGNGNNPVNAVDPDGNALQLILLGGWIAIEMGCSTYDAYVAGKTLADPDATPGEKAFATGAFWYGLAGPLGGATAMSAVTVPGGLGDTLGGVSPVIRRIGRERLGPIFDRVVEEEGMVAARHSLVRREFFYRIGKDRKVSRSAVFMDFEEMRRLSRNDEEFLESVLGWSQAQKNNIRKVLRKRVTRRDELLAVGRSEYLRRREMGLLTKGTPGWDRWDVKVDNLANEIDWINREIYEIMEEMEHAVTTLQRELSP